MSIIYIKYEYIVILTKDYPKIKAIIQLKNIMKI